MSDARVFAQNETYRLPPELDRSTPREVEFTWQARFVVILILVMGVGGVVGGVLMYSKTQSDTALLERELREGIATTGEVVSVVRKGGDEPRMLLTYRYEVAGRQYEGTTKLRTKAAAALSPGARLNIAYFPNEPQRSWMSGHEVRPAPVPVALLIAFVPIFVAGLLRWRLGRDRDLLANGRATMARVVEVKRIFRSTGHGGHYTQRVTVEFETLGGAKQSGRYCTKRAPSAPVVPIVYDADDPKRLTAYPMEMVRLAQW